LNSLILLSEGQITLLLRSSPWLREFAISDGDIHGRPERKITFAVDHPMISFSRCEIHAIPWTIQFPSSSRHAYCLRVAANVNIVVDIRFLALHTWWGEDSRPHGGHWLKSMPITVGSDNGSRDAASFSRASLPKEDWMCRESSLFEDGSVVQSHPCQVIPIFRRTFCRPCLVSVPNCPKSKILSCIFEHAWNWPQQTWEFCGRSVCVKMFPQRRMMNQEYPSTEELEAFWTWNLNGRRFTGCNCICLLFLTNVSNKLVNGPQMVASDQLNMFANGQSIMIVESVWHGTCSGTIIAMASSWLTHLQMGWYPIAPALLAVTWQSFNHFLQALASLTGTWCSGVADCRNRANLHCS